MCLLARFWIAEYRTTHRRQTVERVIDHYLALLADLLIPHTTAIGTEELLPYLGGVLPLPVREPSVAEP